MRASVEIRGPGGHQLVELRAPAIALGRSRENDCVVQDQKVSRHHCRIEASAAGWQLIRLAGSNPVLVGDCALQAEEPRLLVEGERVDFGDSTLWLVAGGVSERTLSTVRLERAARDGPSVSLRFDPHARHSDERIATLQKLGAAVLTEDTDDGLLRTLLAALGGSFPIARGFVGRFDGEGAMQPLAFWSRHAEVERFAVSHELVEQVLAQGVGVADAPSDEGRPGVRPSICVPLAEAGERVGLVYLEGREGWPPFGLEALRFVQLAAHLASLGLANLRLRNELSAENGRLQRELLCQVGLVYASQEMDDLMATARRAARSGATILIEGESGVGKEVLAQAMHRMSKRSEGPFVAMNCAAIPESLLESQLFGHLRGAFTGASRDFLGSFRQADGGTLFLDEIGDMAGALQAKILRVLQERIVTPVGGQKSYPVDVRIIAATNHDLEAAVASGTFRQDLFYRLAVVELQVPPLRQRTSDILPLAQSFYDRFAGRSQPIPPAVARMLTSYGWPGNVRELKNAIESAFAICSNGRPSRKDFPARLRKARPEAGELGSLAEAEREHISRVLEAVEGNLSKAARVLEISRTTLYERLKQHGLRSDGSRQVD